MQQPIQDINIDTEYSTYDGMARQALVWGIPMLPMIFIIGVLVIACMFMFPFFELRSFAILLLAIPLLWFLKSITAKDDQALRIVALEVYWWIQRRNMNIFGNNFTITATKFGRERSDYLRFVKEHTDKAACAARIFAENQSARR